MNKNYRYLRETDTKNPQEVSTNPPIEQQQTKEDTQLNLEYIPCISPSFDDAHKYSEIFTKVLKDNKELFDKVIKDNKIVQLEYLTQINELSKNLNSSNINGPFVGILCQIHPSIINLEDLQDLQDNLQDIQGQGYENRYSVRVTQYLIDNNKLVNCPTVNSKVTLYSKDSPGLTKDSYILTNLLFCIFSNDTTANQQKIKFETCIPIPYEFCFNEETKTYYFRIIQNSNLNEFQKTILINTIKHFLNKNITYFDNILVKLNSNQAFPLKVQIKSTDDMNTNKDKVTAKELPLNPLSKSWTTVQKTLADNFIQSLFKKVATSYTSTEQSQDMSFGGFTFKFDSANSAKIKFKLVERLFTRPNNIRFQEGSVLFGGEMSVSDKAIIGIDTPLNKDILQYNLELDNVTITKTPIPPVQATAVTVESAEAAAVKLINDFEKKFNEILNNSKNTEFTYGSFATFKISVDFLDKEIKCTPVDTSKGIYDISIPVEVTKTDIKQRTLSKVKDVLSPIGAVAAGMSSLAKGGSYGGNW